MLNLKKIIKAGRKEEKKEKQKSKKKTLKIRSKILILCLIVPAIEAVSQKKIIPDTLMFKDQPAALVFFSDIRNSFVFSDIKELFQKTTPVTIWGAGTGVEFKSAHLYSLGFYGLTKNAESRLADNNTGITSINQRWALTFASLGYTYTFYDRKKFEFQLPFEIGIGKGKIQERNNLDNLFVVRQGLVLPFQFGFVAEWKFTKYFGLRGAVGYRKIVVGRLFSHNFDSPYYSIGLSYYYANIFEGLKKLFRKKSNKNSGEVDAVKNVKVEKVEIKATPKPDTINQAVKPKRRLIWIKRN